MSRYYYLRESLFLIAVPRSAQICRSILIVDN